MIPNCESKRNLSERNSKSSSGQHKRDAKYSVHFVYVSNLCSCSRFGILLSFGVGDMYYIIGKCINWASEMHLVPVLSYF